MENVVECGHRIQGAGGEGYKDLFVEVDYGPEFCFSRVLEVLCSYEGCCCIAGEQ